MYVYVCGKCICICICICVSDALVGNMILFGKRVFSVSSGFSFGKGINLFSCGFSEHITTVNFVIGFQGI